MPKNLIHLVNCGLDRNAVGRIKQAGKVVIPATDLRADFIGLGGIPGCFLIGQASYLSPQKTLDLRPGFDFLTDAEFYSLTNTRESMVVNIKPMVMGHLEPPYFDSYPTLYNSCLTSCYAQKFIERLNVLNQPVPEPKPPEPFLGKLSKVFTSTIEE